MKYLFLLGSPDQIQYLVSQGCIPPMCDLLTVMDTRIVQVSLSGLENILRIGEQLSQAGNNQMGNPYANLIEECYGLDKIEFLQSHENMEIYQKAFDIIEHYFGSEDDADAKVSLLMLQLKPTLANPNYWYRDRRKAIQKQWQKTCHWET